MREGALKRHVALPPAMAAVLAVGATACSGTETPAGGLLVQMNVAPPLEREHLTRLTVAISSTDGKAIYRDAGYALDDASSPEFVHFPTSFAVESNGDPNAAIAIDLGVWNGSQALDSQRYRIDNIPTTYVAELPVVFGLTCAAAGPADGSAPSCPLKVWCTWDKNLAVWACDASKLPGLGADAGALWQAAPDATAGNGADAPDSTLGDARDEDSTPETSDDAEASNNAEASDDTNAGDGAEAGDDANAGDDAKAGGDEGTPLNIPCDAPCALGQQCVQGRCVPIPPSCSSGGPGAGRNCGLAAADDCCAGDEIPSGTFFRDYDGLMYQDKSNPATVSQFRLDRYEVTVGRFRAFVSVASAGDGAPAWTPAAGDGKHTHINGTQGLSNGSSAGVRYETGWDASWNVHLPQTKTDWDKQLTKCVWNFVPNGTANTWTAAPGPNENKPIDCLNWYEAYAFCIWDGGFLPSAAEWDYAAAGGTNQNEYAWGAADPGNNADLAVYACFFPHLPYGNHLLGVQNVAPVGLAPKGVGVWGQLDLNGNAIEWILDFSPAPYLLPCVDCAVTASGTQRGLRGGGFDSDLTQLPNSYWVVSPPEQSDAEAGVRCARSPLP